MDLLNVMRSSFPKTIDKSKPIFSSLVANSNNNGAIQKQLIDLFAYMKEWISTPDIYDQTGDMLAKTISFFSYLERFSEETEAGLKERFRAIFVRNHDKKWGTPFDIKNVFRQYFPNATIYLVENTNKIDDTTPGLANLLLDGDIDTASPTDWSLINCSATKAARFSKSYGIELNQSGGILSQTVNVDHSSTYFLHFFLKGKVAVQIKDNHNNYWDYTNKEWKSTAVNYEFTSDEWDNMSIFFATELNVTSVTVSFLYVDTETYIDYFRLFAKQPFGSFTVIAHFEGETADGAFGLAAGDDDPNIETTSVTPPLPRYNNYGYFDKSFLSGVPVGFATDIYEDLLDYLRSQGVKAYLELVLKDF